MKTLKNRCFYCGLATLGRLGVNALAAKTAIVAPTAHWTPKNRENDGPMTPKVGFWPRMEPRGGGQKVTFSTFFHPRTPRAPRRVPEGRFLTVWGRFGSIWRPFWDDFERILGHFSLIFRRFWNRHRANNQSLERSIDRRLGARWRVCRRQLDNTRAFTIVMGGEYMRILWPCVSVMLIGPYINGALT